MGIVTGVRRAVLISRTNGTVVRLPAESREPVARPLDPYSSYRIEGPNLNLKGVGR